LDELTRTSQQSVGLPSEARAWSSEALREFHGQRLSEPASVTVWTSEARRELSSARPPTAAERPFSAEVMRELKGTVPRTLERPFSAEVMRELKGTSSQADDTR